MVGPDCVLVTRSTSGYRAISRNHAAIVQKFLCGADADSDRLHRTCERLAEALQQNQLSLAQIYGLHLPVEELDASRLKGLTKIARFGKTGYNPDEPRVPQATHMAASGPQVGVRRVP